MIRINPDDFRPKLVHGKRVASAEYRSWQMMKNRCLNPKACDFKYYGGRGIGVDKRWLKFNNFIGDIGPKPTAAHTLERRDGNRNYGPSNCEWATRTTQARNRAYCRLTLRGARAIRAAYASGRKLQRELAVEFGVTQTHVSHILLGRIWCE